MGRGVMLAPLRAMTTTTHLPPKHIVVGADFSDVADSALDYAIALARPLDAHITLVHVLEVPVWGFPDAVPVELRELEAIAQQALDDLAKKRADPSVSIRTWLRSGEAWTALVEVAKAEHADLIVVGSHGRRGVGRFLLGSVAERVLRTAECPVLVVGSRTTT